MDPARNFRPAAQYGLAAAMVGAAALVRLPLEPLLQGRAPYGLYYAALGATAWLFSVRATLLASGLSLLGAWYLTLPPRFTFAVPSLPDLLSLIFFAATAAIVTVLARSAAQVRQNLAQLAVIVRDSDDAIVRQRTDGTIETWNAGAERIYGYTAEEIVGRTVWLLVPADRRGEEEQILGRLGRGERIDHYETVRLAKGGRRLDISLSLAPIRNDAGAVVAIAKVARDVTEQKAATRALAEQQDALAEQRRRAEESRVNAGREREELLESERAARSEAERANHLKDEFLATVSHELRTPLNAMLGWTQLLKRKGPADPKMLDRGLEVIERNVQLQTQLISDLLDMSRIASGKLRLELEAVDLAGVIEAAVETARPAAQKKGVRLDRIVEAGAGPVAGDPVRLQQIVSNLLGNAIKFTGEGGQVLVRVEPAYGQTQIVITDTGIGIKPEVLPALFDRFRQADSSTTRRYGGLGLGLAIVRQLTELHGGAVSARSDGEGKGATFTVSLPVALVSTQPAHPASSQSFGHPDGGSPRDLPVEGVKVLVVEDENDTRELLERILSEAGCKVVAVASATAALDALRVQRPDVLLSDIGLPDEDGYSLIRKIRCLPGEAGTIPAIAVTAFARFEDRTRALHAGFQSHVSKPVQPAELLASVATFAGVMRSRDGVAAPLPAPTS